MTIQTLVSSVKQNTAELADKMNLQTDAIIINQCEQNSYDQYAYNGHEVKCYSFEERGVGLSRNNALLRATADIVLFADEDIVYEEGYAGKILKAFSAYPEADMLLFNMEVDKQRATYHTEKKTRVRRYNCGRYPTYSFAVKRECLHKANITFSLLFGGGAKYSNGEDSIFIRECIRQGLKIYALPLNIGKEIPRQSTWFDGYNYKFFFDRGVLYRYLYGNLARPLALRFLLKHKALMFEQQIQTDDAGQIADWKRAYVIMKQGMTEWKRG